MGFWNDCPGTRVTHFQASLPILRFQELFTREPPYHDIRDTRGVIQRILQGQPDRPTNEITYGRMTDQWWEVCCLCWKRDESSRPPISDIVAAIVSILSHVYFLLLMQLRRKQRCLLAERDHFECLYMLPCSLHAYLLRCIFLSASQAWLSCTWFVIFRILDRCPRPLYATINVSNGVNLVQCVISLARHTIGNERLQHVLLHT